MDAKKAFAMGVCSVFASMCFTKRRNSRVRNINLYAGFSNDRKNLANDWVNIGNDMSHSMKKLKKRHYR